MSVSTPAALWVTRSAGLPCGARLLGDTVLGPAAPGRTWLDVCIIGQHLPQMYQPSEIFPLTAGGCPRLGLCPDCLGFGDLSPAPAGDPMAAARGVDQVRQPCPGCGGTGRPAVRVTIARGLSGEVTGTIRPLPHEYVSPLEAAAGELVHRFPVPADTCLACGSPRGGCGPRGEALHP